MNFKSINQPQNIAELLVNIASVFESFDLLKSDFLAANNLKDVFSVNTLRVFPVNGEVDQRRFRSSDLGSLSKIIEYEHHSAPQVKLSGGKIKTVDSKIEVYFKFIFQIGVVSYREINLEHILRITFTEFDRHFHPYPPRPTHPYGNKGYSTDKISDLGKSTLSFTLHYDGSLSMLVIRQIGMAQ